MKNQTGTRHIPLSGIDLENTPYSTPDPSVTTTEIRLSATYPATDGTAPESIELTWHGTMPDPEALCQIIAELAAVTKGRQVAKWPIRTQNTD